MLAAIVALLAAASVPGAGITPQGTVTVTATYAGQPADALDLLCIQSPGSDFAPTCHVADKHHVSTLRNAPGRYYVIDESDNGPDRCYARKDGGHCAVIRLHAGEHKHIHWHLDRHKATVPG